MSGRETRSTARHAGAHAVVHDGEAQVAVVGPSPGPAFARGLWRIAAADVSSGNSVELLHDGPRTYDVMIAAIAAAIMTS